MFIKNDRKFVRKWRKVRRKGFLRYAITQGLLFGVLVGGLVVVIMYIDHPQDIDLNEFIFKAILIVLGVAIIYALFSWFINNFIYENLK